MRLWSISPEYLDRIGLVSLWREGLLARKVILGKTRGYRFHPQLERFKKYDKPIEAIDSFLTYVYIEATQRGYKFDKTKINFLKHEKIIKISSGQLYFEFNHFLDKLKKRDIERYNLLVKMNINKINPNPIFEVYKKETTENWERV